MKSVRSADRRLRNAIAHSLGLVTRFRPFVASLLWVVVSLAGMTVASEARSQVRTPKDFIAGSDYRGLTHRISFDSSGSALMATHDALYSYNSGVLKRVAVAANSNTELALAPVGGIYAWLEHDRVPDGLFTVQLVKYPNRPLGQLRLADYPFGFSAVYFGGAGKLIVTASPLDNPENAAGPYRYDFWDQRGRLLSTTRLQGRAIGIVDIDGNAILLLGESAATAFNRDGSVLWRLDGSFRKGALSDDGETALLNPSQRSEINTVVVYDHGSMTRTVLNAPVHDLALAANGVDGAVAVDRGELFFLSPRSCHGSTCLVRPVPTFPSSSDIDITDLRFVDGTTLVVATIQRSGNNPPYSFRTGAIHVVNSSGHPEYDFPVALEQPAPGRPLIEATFGVRMFATHTPHRTVFVDLGP